MDGKIVGQSSSYRQGLVLGLTMAELMLLLIFCLLIALAAELERRATTKNNENQSVCDRFSIVCISYTGTSYPDWVSY